MIEEEKEPAVLAAVRENSEEYVLTYPLTEQQKMISDACMKNIVRYDVLLKCICGSGKTEMVIAPIAMFLKHHLKVCFAISRRQVVLEVAERLQKYFINANVIPVCQGYTAVTDGDLIVCTTHQLYRYYDAFDLLILDEPDAFPFRGSEVLHGIAKTACRGHSIYLTATPDEELMKQVREGTMICLTLNQRPHGKPIPVPKIRIGPKGILLFHLLRWLEAHEDHPRMIFVPTIAEAKRLHLFLSFLYDCAVCTSKTEERDAVISSFRSKEHSVIVATTVLERGVTIPRADICVYEADHSIFDEAGLIQMAGRAGRSFEDPYGDVLFLCSEKSELCEKCVQSLQEANASCGV
jgi:competence protein ComFA